MWDKNNIDHAFLSVFETDFEDLCIDVFLFYKDQKQFQSYSNLLLLSRLGSIPGFK